MLVRPHVYIYYHRYFLCDLPHAPRTQQCCRAELSLCARDGPEPTGGAGRGRWSCVHGDSTGTEHSGRLFLTVSFAFALPGDFERAGTAPSNLTSRSNATPWSICFKRFSTDLPVFTDSHQTPPKKGGSYLENCSGIPSRHLVHSNSSMFAIQCIHLDTILFKRLSHIVLHCFVP